MVSGPCREAMSARLGAACYRPRMQIAMALAALFLNFSGSLDLCADVYLDDTGEPLTDVLGQTLSRYCQWTGPDAPALDSDVCCTIDGDGAHCELPDEHGRCALGLKMSCDYGAVLGDGVTCYQPFPSACAHGFCKDDVSSSPDTLAQLLCCTEGGCEPINGTLALDCEDMMGTIVWCNDGVSNLDGTMECLD